MFYSIFDKFPTQCIGFDLHNSPICNVERFYSHFASYSEGGPLDQVIVRTL